MFDTVEPWMFAALAGVVLVLWLGIRNLDRWSDRTDKRLAEIEERLSKAAKGRD